MARLIIKNGYLKGSAKSSSHKNYLVNYIATRDGVECLKLENSSSTKKQKKLIVDILKDFPTTKLSFEYDDYMLNPTAENASEFIMSALEQNVYKIQNRQKYLNYIANRPRVEKTSSHGLFNGTDSNIVLSKVAKEIANHNGNVWTPIISLHREDANITGFENAHEWQALISEQVLKISESFKIHPDNFKWYGAFHNESHHPHVHLICYSTNENEGYLTKQGIEKMKSALQTEIFRKELTPLYENKTKRRDELKKEVQKSFVELKSKLVTTDYTNPKLEFLITQLDEKLKTHKGKKQYGYLQPNVKKIVNQIVDELAQEPNVKSAFSLWQDLQDEIYHSYKDTLPERLALSEQKEFKSIKNMIISEVLKLEEMENIVAQDVENAVQTVSFDAETNVNANNFTQEINNNISTNNNSNTVENIAPSVAFAVSNIFSALSNIFQENTPKDSTTSHQKIDSKSLRKLRELKALRGQKHTGEDTEMIYKSSNSHLFG
ncbi:MAG: MobP3 family relaxase [Clostridia bacterium]